MFSKYVLDDEGRRLYERVADLLGPVGVPALTELCQLAYETGEEHERMRESEL